MSQHDLVIRGGTLVDGTGDAPRVGDLAIDGGAHCGAICDAGTPTQYGLFDRGELKPGLKADVNVIDFERLGLENPEMRHDFPASGRRLYQAARGYVATIVSGQVIFEEGVATGALPGKLIRGAQPGLAGNDEVQA